MQKKRLTRREKIQFSKKGLCWKCETKLKQSGRTLVCENCGFKIAA